MEDADLLLRCPDGDFLRLELERSDVRLSDIVKEAVAEWKQRRPPTWRPGRPALESWRPEPTLESLEATVAALRSRAVPQMTLALSFHEYIALRMAYDNGRFARTDFLRAGVDLPPQFAGALADPEFFERAVALADAEGKLLSLLLLGVLRWKTAALAAAVWRRLDGRDLAPAAHEEAPQLWDLLHDEERDSIKQTLQEYPPPAPPPDPKDVEIVKQLGHRMW